MWAENTGCAICWGYGRLVVLNGSFLISWQNMGCPPAVIWQGAGLCSRKGQAPNILQTSERANDRAAGHPAEKATTFLSLFAALCNDSTAGLEEFQNRAGFYRRKLCVDGVRQMCLCWIYSAGKGRAVREGWAEPCAASANGWCNLHRLASFYRLLTRVLY